MPSPPATSMAPRCRRDQVVPDRRRAHRRGEARQGSRSGRRVVVHPQVIEEISSDPLTVSAEAIVVTPTNTASNLTCRNSMSSSRSAAPRRCSPCRHLSTTCSSTPCGGRSGPLLTTPPVKAAASRRSTTIADAVGTRWCSSCLPNCGLRTVLPSATLHDTDRDGPGRETVVRLAPGVRTFDQAVKLAEGRSPAPDTAMAGLQAFGLLTISTKSSRQQWRTDMPVTSLDALLPARAALDGRARRHVVRHRQLEHARRGRAVPDQRRVLRRGCPSRGASHDRMNLVLVHDHETAEFYDEIVPFAVWLDDYFGGFQPGRDSRIKRDGTMVTTAQSTPQLVVQCHLRGASWAASVAVRVLGRFAVCDLAIALVPAGRHLHFLRDHLRVPGQQMIVPLAQLLADQLVNTADERGSACRFLRSSPGFDPPAGGASLPRHGGAEDEHQRRPIPPGAHDEELYDLLDSAGAYRKAARGSPARVEPSRSTRWERLVTPAWGLCWDVLEEEHRRRAESPVAVGTRTARRTPATLIGNGPLATSAFGRPRARQPPHTRVILSTLSHASPPRRRSTDPLRMIPYVLPDEAIVGEVVRVDTSARELLAGRTARLPARHRQLPARLPHAAQQGTLVASLPSTAGSFARSPRRSRTVSTCTVTLRRVASSTSNTAASGGYLHVLLGTQGPHFRPAVPEGGEHALDAFRLASPADPASLDAGHALRISILRLLLSGYPPRSGA